MRQEADGPVEEFAAIELVRVEVAVWAFGTRDDTVEGPQVRTADWRLSSALGSESECPLADVSTIPDPQCWTPVVDFEPVPLGTAVAFSSCSLNFPPHSRIRCSSASSRLTSFSRV